MQPNVHAHLLYYPVALCVAAYTVWAVCRARAQPRLDWLVASIGIAFCFVKQVWIIPPTNLDFEIFHRAGVAIAHGDNPYADPFMLNPPPGLPLLAVLGLFDLRTSAILWTLFNVTSGLLLCAVASRFVGRIPKSLLAVLCASVGLSIPMHYAVLLGQLSVWTALGACLAMLLAARRRPLSAGVVLALAFIKPQSALPVMVRFARGRLWLTYISTAVVLILLTFASGQVGHLAASLRLMQHNIAALAGVGSVNDFSNTGPNPYTVIGFERFLWCFGVRDLTWARTIGLVLTVAAGGALLWNVARARVDDRAAAALTGFYSLFFLYHRTHDSVILALPLVYLVAEIHRKPRDTRLVVLAFSAVMAVLAIHPVRLESVASKLPEFLATPLLGPLPTTLLLIASIATFVHARAQATCTVQNEQDSSDSPIRAL